MIQQLAKPALIMITALVIAWIIFRLINFGPEKRNTSFGKEILILLFAIYIVCVLLLTLYPLPMTRTRPAGVIGVNYTPVINTLKILQTERSFMTGNTLENIFGNLLLFIPFGFLLPLLSSKLSSFLKIFGLSLAFSICIELAQLVSSKFGIYRSVDVDDVILNVIGASLGFLFIRMIYKPARK